MASYKAPGFQERSALAQQAKLKALKLLQTKPQLDEAAIAERKAAAEAREAAEAAKRAARREALEQEKAEKLAKKLANEKPAKIGPTEDEKKAARDAKYAARKARKR